MQFSHFSFDKLEWQHAMDSKYEYGKSQIALKLNQLLEDVVAVHEGSSFESINIIFDIFKPIFLNLPNLMELFHNYVNVVEMIFRVLCEITSKLIFYLNETIPEIFENCVTCVSVYIKHNSTRITNEATRDDDNLDDLLLLIKLLNHLVAKDFWDDDADEHGPETSENGACLAIMQYVIQIITFDMLKYPTLCAKFYQTILLFLESKGDLLNIMSIDLLNAIFQSINLGLRSFTFEIQSICFDCIGCITSIMSLDRRPHPNVANGSLIIFRTIIEMIIAHEISSDNKKECSSALFRFICLYRDQYTQIVQGVLQTIPNEENQKRLNNEFANLTTNISAYNFRSLQNFQERYEKFIANISFIYN